MVSQAKLNHRRWSIWTIEFYHIQNLSTLCKYKNVEIIAGAVCVDNVHLSIAIPPKLSVSDFMGYLKGKSTLMIYDRHPELQSKWDKAFWARGYYVETIGNITDEAVQKYIKEQAVT